MQWADWFSHRKSLSTLIFENKCMIRFADPPTPVKWGFIRWQDTISSFSSSNNKQLLPRQLWLKQKKNKTKSSRLFLTLNDCFTHPMQHQHHHCPGHVMSKAYLRLTFRHNKTQTPLCCSRYFSIKKTHLSGRQWELQCPNTLIRQPQHIHFCGRCHYRVSLQYKTNCPAQ